MGSPRRAAILSSTLLVLLSISLSAHAQTEEPQDGGLNLRLVWERTFDREITAAGVDADCFASAEGDISSCLKWILLYDELTWLGGSSQDTGEALRGLVYPSCISPDGNYLIRVEFSRDSWTYHYTMFDWDRDGIWRADYGRVFPVVLDDGSAVFPNHDYSDHFTSIPFRGLKWFDAQGRVVRKHDFLGKHSLWGTRYLATSDSFTAVAAADSGRGLVVYLFNEHGELIWENASIEHSGSGAVAVSARGNVVLALRQWMPSDVYVFVLDREGTLRDSLCLGSTGMLQSVRALEDLALVSTGRTVNNPGYLLCYDLEKMQPRFLVEGKGSKRYATFDVDADAGLVAVAVSESESKNFISVCDLAGEVKAQVSIGSKSVGYGKPWLKLLKDALIVGDESSLRLYSLEKD